MSLSSVPRVLFSGVKFLINGREKSFTMNRVRAKELARGQFSKALREAFPGRSDAETARQAAGVLDRSERQICNWLNEESSPPIEDVFTVCAILGVFRTMEIFTEDQSRNDILGQIGQGRS